MTPGGRQRDPRRQYHSDSWGPAGIRAVRYGSREGWWSSALIRETDRSAHTAQDARARQTASCVLASGCGPWYRARRRTGRGQHSGAIRLAERISSRGDLTQHRFRVKTEKVVLPVASLDHDVDVAMAGAAASTTWVRPDGASVLAVDAWLYGVRRPGAPRTSPVPSPCSRRRG